MLDTVCYRFEEVATGKSRGVFDKHVDMVYLLTLEGSDRTENAIERVGAISSRLTVQYNKGYNCAHKNLSIKKSHADLSHALGNIFRHAARNKYTNILVLEDDFVFDSDYYTRDDVNEIGRFISEGDFQTYNIGGLPVLSFPISQYHRRGVCCPTSHGVIYNKSYFLFYHSIMKAYDYDIHCDDVHSFNMDIKHYVYYKPICFQTFPPTENRRNWPSTNVIPALVDALGLDKSYENFQPVCMLLTTGSDLIVLFMLFVMTRHVIRGSQQVPLIRN